VIIATAVLTKLSISSIIVRQIPVVLVMVIVGYIVGFWKVSQVKKDAPDIQANRKSDLNNFFISFFPILATILIDVALNLAGFNQLLSGFDVVIAILIGIAIFVVITKLNSMVFVKPLKSWGIWGITAAAYGAFLLRNVMDAAGISNVFSSYVANGSIDVVLFLAVGPALLGLLTGSAQGGVAVSVSILSTIFPLPFAAKVAALVYISAYLGYTIAPTHLCLTFTADYFKCSLGKMYKYIIPSFLITFSIALLVYFLL
jgi:hypothetical protein